MNRMKKACLFSVYLVSNIIQVVCYYCMHICKYIFKWFFCLYRLMERVKMEMIRLHLSVEDKEIKNYVEVVPIEKEKALPDISIVGKSKTGFMKELPVLKVKEVAAIEPFKSEPLEKVVVESEFEPENVDVDVSLEMDETEIDSFEAETDLDDGNDAESDMNSTGVSFEELSDTISILGKDEMTDSEKEKATGVLNTIEGTELFTFITINNSTYENAKMLMKSFDKNIGGVDDFDIKRFMG